MNDITVPSRNPAFRQVPWTPVLLSHLVLRRPAISHTGKHTGYLCSSPAQSLGSGTSWVRGQSCYAISESSRFGLYCLVICNNHTIGKIGDTGNKSQKRNWQSCFLCNNVFKSGYGLAIKSKQFRIYKSTVNKTHQHLQ